MGAASHGDPIVAWACATSPQTDSGVLGASTSTRLDLGDAVSQNLATYGNMQSDTESTAPFALRLTGLLTGRTRFAGTLYAAPFVDCGRFDFLSHVDL